MLTFLGIADHFKPRWIVWENVPGVLSSNGGKDFATFLGALGELGYGFAYRVLDAQYFGVAQRRRRVFVVGCLGDWKRAAAVLFDSESLSGNPAPSREKREEVAKCITAGIGKRYDSETDTMIPSAQPTVLMDQGGSVMNIMSDGTVGTLRRETHGHEPVIMQPIAFGVGEKPDVGHCLRSGASKADKHESTTYIKQSMAVRRLTPTECERLQGFPDGYTDIQPNGKQTPDGPRYKALGNSMAVPVMRWIGERIQMGEEI
jgi:DNA (cytosine-5)-methyltransferase 1